MLKQCIYTIYLKLSVACSQFSLRLLLFPLTQSNFTVYFLANVFIFLEKKTISATHHVHLSRHLQTKQQITFHAKAANQLTAGCSLADADGCWGERV